MRIRHNTTAARRLTVAIVGIVTLAGQLGHGGPPSWANEAAEDGEKAEASAYAGVGTPEEAPPNADGPQEVDYSDPHDPNSFRTFVQRVADNVNWIWAKAFASGDPDQTYEPAQLVLLEGEEEMTSPCGQDLGPDRQDGRSPAHYCDDTIYLSLHWLRGQPRQYGDFAVASVIAHEFGHHVQATLGILNTGRPEKTTEELEADCLSGIWAFSAYAEDYLTDEHIDQAVSLQYDGAGGRHGTGEQREEWFRDGYRDGEADDCDSWRWDDSPNAPPNPGREEPQ